MKYILLLIIIFGFKTYNFSQCVNPSLIDSFAICPMIYAPVCGCDGITYSNDCIAVNLGGVTAWTEGACSSTISCSSFCVENISFDTSGILNVSINFSGDFNNFINYPYVSQVLNQNGDVIASGELAYFGQVGGTTIPYSVSNSIFSAPFPPNFIGSVIFNYDNNICVLPYPCGDIITCIDSTQINPDIMCTADYNPVCGCNDITYSNACIAENWFGVTSWTPGECQGSITFADSCADLAGIDFGACTMFMGYGLINGICSPISGCGTIVGNIDYALAIDSSLENCQACLPSSLSEQDLEINLYPNPASEHLTLTTNYTSGNSELVILDVLNREVHTGSFSGNKVEIDLSNFVKGTYILQLKQNNKISRLFFMKQ